MEVECFSKKRNLSARMEGEILFEEISHRLKLTGSSLKNLDKYRD